MNRSSRAALVVVSSVLALAVLTLLPFAIYGNSADPEDAEITQVVAMVLAPGAFIAVCWLIRMIQWFIASRAIPRQITVTAYLAQTPKASERGKAVQVMERSAA